MIGATPLLIFGTQGACRHIRPMIFLQARLRASDPWDALPNQVCGTDSDQQAPRVLYPGDCEFAGR
jgi:hypothetical protein